MKTIFYCLAVAIMCSATASAAHYGLKLGTPNLKSAKSLTFGPADVLFVGDTKSATVFAISTGDTEGDAANTTVEVNNIGVNLSDMFSGPTKINDLVVNPATGTVFVACETNGRPSIVKVTQGGRKMQSINLSDVLHSSVVLADAPEDKVTGQGRRKRNNRADAITDLAFFEGKLLISGLRTRGSASSVRELDFPFAGSDKGIGVQIYHAAHDKEEDYSAMRTFVPLMIDGKPNLLAAYVCTPLVKIPLDSMDSASEKVNATTVAELGNRNKPLDMISYEKDGAEFLLLSNSARGVMKITTAGLRENEGLTEPVRGGGTAGQGFESVESMNGVLQMDKLNETHAVVLIDNNGALHLKTVALP